LNALSEEEGMELTEWLDPLIEHEIAYVGMVARCERTLHASYLFAPELPQYRDANRALRLRAGDSSPDMVAREVVEYYTARGLRPAADIDPIAEEQGIGAALRALGLAPVAGHRLLMRYTAGAAPVMRASDAIVEVVPNETGRGEAAEWIETAVADDIGWADEALWRAVAGYEARYSACRLYLARLDGRSAGACDLFEAANWGRIDSVVTRPELRRRGVAAMLVSRAVADSLTSGNSETYLFTELGSDAERLYRRLGFTAWHLDVFRQHRA